MTEDNFSDVKFMADHLVDLLATGRTSEAHDFCVDFHPIDQTLVATLMEAMRMGLDIDHAHIEICTEMFFLAMIDLLVDVPGSTEDADRELNRIRPNFKQ